MKITQQSFNSFFCTLLSFIASLFIKFILVINFSRSKISLSLPNPIVDPAHHKNTVGLSILKKIWKHSFYGHFEIMESVTNQYLTLMILIIS